MGISYFSQVGKITKVSIGLVATMAFLWIMFHTQQYIPDGQKDYFLTVFLMYGVFGAFVFGNSDTRNKLYNVQFTRFLPRFLIFFSISFILFSIIIAKLNIFDSSYLSFLSGIPLWLAIIHALVYATIESAVWQGYLDDKLGHPWSELSAGLFHFGVWTGGAVLVILSATVLFFIFSFTNWRFRDNQNDLAPAIGVHSAFNIVKLGVMAFK